MEAKTYQIVDGPNAFDLAIALFRNGPRDSVVFKLSDGKGYTSYITAAQSRDTSSANGWKLRGHIDLGLVGYEFTAKYSTSTRKGTLTVLKRK